MKTMLLILMGVVFGAAMDCDGAEKRRIKLEFKIERQDWRDAITDLAPSDADAGEFLASLEQDVAAKLASVFNQSLSFAEFVTEPSNANDVTLRVSLVPRGVSENSFRRTDLKLEIHGLNQSVGVKQTKLEFTDGDEGHAIDREFIETSPVQRMQDHLGLSANLVVDECLSYVPLAPQISLVRLGNRTVGVLPWSHVDLGAATDTEFKITTLDPNFGFPREHHTRVIYTEPLATHVNQNVTPPFADGLIVTDRIPPLGSPLGTILFQLPAAPIPIEGLYIKYYEPLRAPEPEPHTPDTFEDPSDGDEDG